MKYLLTALFSIILIFLVSCNGLVGRGGGGENKAFENSEPIVKLDKPNKPKIEYDKSDPDWQQKREIDLLFAELSSPAWKKRESAQNKLLDLVLSSKSWALDYLIIRSLKQDDPEISFRSKKVIKNYFEKTIYDPDRKKGFIGLELEPSAQMEINNVMYDPILVRRPKDGFPGKAAGIKEGDLILGVDGKACNRNFIMSDFILYIASLKPGTEIDLAIFSFGKVD